MANYCPEPLEIYADKSATNPLKVYATTEYANCREVTIDWGDGSPHTTVPVDCDHQAIAAHVYPAAS